MQTSGVVLDVYDDVGGVVLRSMFTTREDLPDFVKAAHAVTSAERENLPDESFALVLINNGEKLRKFACVDEGNTALSVLYFLKNAHKLPAEARVITAENLKVASEWYGLDIPEELEKEAGLLGNVRGAAGALAGVGRAAVGAAAAPATAAVGAAKALVNPLGFAAKNPIGAAMTAMTLPSVVKGTKGAIADNLQKVRMGEAVAGGTHGGLAALSGGMEHLASADPIEEAFKVADVTGTTSMPISVDATKKPVATAAAISKSAHMRPHVDVSDLEPEKVATARATRYHALDGRYPLDSYEQVKLASSYFEQFAKHLEPAERREFCTNLVKRASDLSIPMSDVVRKYAGEKYASATEIDVAMDTRRSVLKDPELHGLLDKIAAARPDMAPEEFVVVLDGFDKAAGLQYHYDGHVMDPFYSTYGFEKTAEDEKETFTDSIGIYHVTACDLKKLGLSGRQNIKKVFGGEFADEFQKDPIGIYKSMPVEQKKLIIRMATENSPL